MATVIMVASGKGGTGKSTVSCLLALRLAGQGKKTLIVELDSRLRSIDVILGAGERVVYDVGDALKEPENAPGLVTKVPCAGNLYILPAPYRDKNADFSALGKVIDRLYGDYDYIIEDVCAGMGRPFAAACRTASTGIVVATADAVSVRDGREVSERMFRRGIREIRLVINKFDRRIFSRSGYRDLDRVIDGVCAQLLGVVPMSGIIAACGARGEELPPNSREKRIFDALALRLLGKDIQIII